MKDVPITFVNEITADAVGFVQDQPAGAATWGELTDGPGSAREFSYVCPCGCQRLHHLRVAMPAADQAPDNNRYTLSDSLFEPTLQPGLDHSTDKHSANCGWRGELNTGVFQTEEA